MKFLFVQWRYHTNRHPMVKALQDGGHEVKYISQFANPKMENYSAIEPVVVGYSSVFELLTKVSGLSDSGARMKFGWAPVWTLWREMKEFDPDVVIVRNYGIPQAVALGLGNLLGASGIVQELHPKFKTTVNQKKTFLDRQYERLWGDPLVRVTPVLGEPRKGQTTSNVYYVPYPIDVDLYEPFGEKQYFRDGHINLIFVGTLTAPRKRHIDLLEAFEILSNDFDIRLTLVGHLDETDNDYYQKIQEYIKRKKLKDEVDIKTNVPHEQLQQMYKEYDLFVFPSVDEPLGMAGLEALAAGLPLICSTDAGVSSYVEEGYNGYTFKENCFDEMVEKIRLAIQSQEQVIEMSRNATEQITRDHLPTVYCENMERIIESNFGEV